MALGTTDTFAVKKTAPGKHFIRVYGSMDARAGNNKTLGIKLALNGTAIDESECRAFTGSSAQEAKLVTSWIIEMDEGDEVALFAANISDTVDIDLQRARIVAAAVTQPGLTGPTGATGATGPQGPAGLGTVAVTAPITNTGTSTDAVIGIDTSGLLPTAGTNISVAGTEVSVIDNPTFSGLVTTNNGITNAQAKNALIASGYDSVAGNFAHNSRVIITATGLTSGDPTTRPDGTTLQVGDVWLNF
jgi:hypothetical protein